MIENKSKRRPAEGDHFETKDAYADWATTDEEWEAAGLTRVSRTDAAKRATSDGKAITSSDEAQADALAQRIVQKVRVGRRVREIVSDRQTLDAASSLERSGAISPEGARDIRRQVVMRRNR